MFVYIPKALPKLISLSSCKFRIMTGNQKNAGSSRAKTVLIMSLFLYPNRFSTGFFLERTQSCLKSLRLVGLYTSQSSLNKLVKKTQIFQNFRTGMGNISLPLNVQWRLCIVISIVNVNSLRLPYFCSYPLATKSSTH